MKLINPHLDQFPSLVAMFFDRAEKGGESPFLWRKSDRVWQPLSWRQVANQVAALAHNLRELGLKDVRINAALPHSLRGEVVVG